jgi:hypothetical protein
LSNQIAMSTFSKLTQNFDHKILKLILKSTTKNFLIGCSITTLLTLFSKVQQLLGWKKKEGKNFELSEFLKTAIKNGLFISTWTFSHQILIRLLESNFERPQAKNLVISGLLSGSISMYFLQGLSWQSSLYFVYRSLFGVYRIKKNIFPSWTDIPDYLAYCIINFFLGIMAERYTYYNNQSYADFLSYCANFKLKNINYMFTQESNTFPECYPHYHEEKSCLESGKNRLFGSFRNNLKLQLSFQIFSYLVKGSLFTPKSLESYLNMWKNLFKNSMRTTMFLTLQCVLCGPTACVHKLFTNERNLFVIGLIWFVSSFAILLESPTRRSEISCFTIWRVTTGFINLFNGVSFGQKNSKEFDVFASTVLFGIGSAFSIYCMYRDPKNLKSLDQSILTTFFPKNLLK